MIAGAGDGMRFAAIQTALADLERALVRDRCHVVVSVPAGPARMLLQGALAGRLAGALRVVPMPELADGADGELCAAILRELGEPPGDDPEASLVGVARRLAGQRSALALVVGDARSLSLPTLRLLGRLVARAKPGLRLVLLSPGAGSGDALGEIMTPLGIGAVKVVLEAPRERGGPAAAPAPPRSPVPVAPVRARSAARAPIRVASGESGGHRTPARWRAALGLSTAALGLLVAIQRLDLPSLREAAAPPARSVAEPEQRTAPQEPSESAPALPDAVGQPVASTEPGAAEVARPERPAKPEATEVPAVTEATEASEVPTLPELPVLQPAAPEVVVAEMISAEIAAAAGAPAEPAPPEVAAPAAPAPEPLTPETVAAAEPEAPAAPPPTILVSLNADPWAHIQVDGRDVGVTPMSDLALTPGPHRFRVRFPDGRVIERTVRVDAVRDHIRFP